MAAIAEDDFDAELPLPEPFEWANRAPAPPVGDETVFSAAARGALAELRFLAEHEGLAVDERDAFDATPLYYACLTGQYECAEYLLARGARCETNTFDAERCRYAALTDDLRRLLAVFGAAGRARGPLASFAFRVFNSAAAATRADLELVVASDGARVRVHRCLLAARNARLARLLRTRWRGRAVVTLVDARMRGPTLLALLGVLYTERLLAPPALLPEVAAAARALRMPQLAEYCEAADAEEAAAAARRRAHGVGARAAGGGGGGAVRKIVCREFGLSYSVGSLPEAAAIEADAGGAPAPAEGDLRSALWRGLLRRGVVPDAALLDHRAAGEDVEEGGGAQEAAAAAAAADASATAVDVDALYPDLHSDLQVTVRGRAVFHAHSAFLCGRSAFFASLVSFSGEEGAGVGGAGASALAAPLRRRAVALDEASPFTFAVLCEFLYADAVREAPTAALALELLAICEAWVVPDIKAPAVARAAAHLRRDTLADLLAAADVFRLHRLTALGARFAASDIDFFASGRVRAEDGGGGSDDGGGGGAPPGEGREHADAFAALVLRDARAVRGRQEFDSAPILDEVRAAVASLFRGAHAEAERARRLALVDQLRARLGLKTRV